MSRIVTVCTGVQHPHGQCLLNDAILFTDDTIKQSAADFDALEKKRLERAAKAEKNKKRVQPFLNAITEAGSAESFAKATDDLALWLIGEGKLPEGLDAPGIRDIIQDSFEALPTVKYSCLATRTNQGVCL